MSQTDIDPVCLRSYGLQWEQGRKEEERKGNKWINLRDIVENSVIILFGNGDERK